MSTKKPELHHEPPAGLLSEGSELWGRYASRYEMRPDELRFLEDACRLADMMAALREAAEGEPMMVKGSTGQPVLNPLMAEQKTHALAIGTLLGRIKLPDLDEGVASNQNRSAANASWQPGVRGRGA